MSPETIVLIVAISLLSAAYLFAVWVIDLQGLIRGWLVLPMRVLATIFGSLVVTYLLWNLQNIQAHYWVLISLYVGLVGVTVVYALSTHRQAKASAEMAKEMKEQRQPLVILKAVQEEGIWTDLQIQFIGIEKSAANYFSHFEISNVGKTPAIEVESSLMDSEGNRPHSIRQTYLRNDDPPIKFRPNNIENLDETKTYYLVSEYQNIFSYSLQKPLYQTRLPFKISKASKEGKIYIIAGELEFNEVPQIKRIDAFGSRSKPK